MFLDNIYSLTTGKYINSLYSVDNMFIRQLAALSGQSANQAKLVSFVMKNNVNNRGEIAKKGVSAADKSIIDICKLSPLVDQNNKSLLQEIALYRASTLNFADAGPTFVKDNMHILMVDYLLSASLCYIEVFGGTRVDKFFATRNRFIAGVLAGLEPKDTAKYANYLQTYSANYTMGQLKVLKINMTKKGFSITQPRSSIDFTGKVKITPVFLITSFIEGITNILKKSIIKFTYIKDNLTEREFVTTISPDILVKYYEPEFVQKMLEGVSVQIDRGYIRLPELGISKYDETGVRALNISRITSIEVVNEFDTRYIDVDFNLIIPSFKETVDHIKDMNVLNMIHNELVGKPANVSSIHQLRDTLHSFVDGQYAVGTTTALRHLHNYMVSRKQIFRVYHEGKPVNYGTSAPTFRLGTSDN